MSRKKLVLALVPMMLALVAGCRHDDGEASSTTTIRSGTPGGIRVTNTPPRTTTIEDRTANRLAAAVCAFRRECAASERPDVSSEAVLLDETVCTAELQADARRTIAGWRCSPARAPLGLEDCLAAIKAERCRDLTLEGVTAMRECRPSAVCQSGNDGSTQ
ncbi:MAG TPA: DUF6184 family natural product biosynthesis lipoprotein [Labilithrix sp.]|nr:DUF6184 family natural product biosynthesis lipoprotein [Labilithrix sp.]